MLRLPLTSVLLATLLLLSDRLAVMALVIVTVTVAHVAAARLQGRLGPRSTAGPPPPAGTPTEPSPAPPARLPSTS